jgi:hypothetical protein
MPGAIPLVAGRVTGARAVGRGDGRRDRAGRRRARSARFGAGRLRGGRFVVFFLVAIGGEQL